MNEATTTLTRAGSIQTNLLVFFRTLLPPPNLEEAGHSDVALFFGCVRGWEWQVNVGVTKGRRGATRKW
jgi:hypothetical protein